MNQFVHIVARLNVLSHGRLAALLHGLTCKSAAGFRAYADACVSMLIHSHAVCSDTADLVKESLEQQFLLVRNRTSNNGEAVLQRLLAKPHCLLEAEDAHRTIRKALSKGPTAPAVMSDNAKFRRCSLCRHVRAG